MNRRERNGVSDRRDEPVGELIKDLSREVSTLVHQEIALAKAEMTEKGKKAGVGAGMLGGAGVFALAAVGGSMATIILILATFMPDWVAALFTTALYAGVAAVLALRGRDRLKETGAPIPERTKESVKEDIEWAKTHARSSAR